MMGALLEETECLAAGTAWSVLQDKVKKLDLLELDRKALSAGRLFIDEHAHIGALDQPLRIRIVRATGLLFYVRRNFRVL